MLLGCLDRGHVARWLRQISFLASDADYLSLFFTFQPDVVGLIGEAGVWFCDLEQEVGGPMADHLAKEVDAGDMYDIAAALISVRLARGPAMAVHRTLLVGAGVGIGFPCGAAMSPKFCQSPVVRE